MQYSAFYPILSHFCIPDINLNQIKICLLQNLIYKLHDIIYFKFELFMPYRFFLILSATINFEIQ